MKVAFLNCTDELNPEAGSELTCDRDIGRSELASYLDHYAIFAETVLDAVF